MKSLLFERGSRIEVGKISEDRFITLKYRRNGDRTTLRSSNFSHESRGHDHLIPLLLSAKSIWIISRASDGKNVRSRKS